MKYLSLDIETTGLDPKRDQVLHIAVVEEDTGVCGVAVDNLPYWECLIRHNRIEGDPYALAMNIDILDVLQKELPWHPVNPPRRDKRLYRGREVLVYRSLDDALSELLQWGLFASGKRQTIAGKNVAGFDIPFLGPRFKNYTIHRVIDAGAVALGIDPSLWANDKPPMLGDLINTEVTHDALEDARDVVRVLRRAY
jgi:oligoribonuclease (3'-5' exoribonuclease)